MSFTVTIVITKPSRTHNSWSGERLDREIPKDTCTSQLQITKKQFVINQKSLFLIKIIKKKRPLKIHKTSRSTYNTPMTFLMMDWNSSAVYSQVGKGAIRIFEGLNCINGNLSEEAVPKDCPDVSSIFWEELVSVCWAANIMNASITCWSCRK